jgi:hypothetical protein
MPIALVVVWSMWWFQLRSFPSSTPRSEVHVDWRVPQGTVLGPLMFLLYVNYIDEGVNSEVKLFADDCLLYRTIESATIHGYDLLSHSGLIS